MVKTSRNLSRVSQVSQGVRPTSVLILVATATQIYQFSDKKSLEQAVKKDYLQPIKIAEFA